MKIFFAELLGTFLLVLLGDGSVAQVVLGNTARSDKFFGGFLNIALGYGLALMVGICASGGVSGGHLNPAVSLAMAVIRTGLNCLLKLKKMDLMDRNYRLNSSLYRTIIYDKILTP